MLEVPPAVSLLNSVLILKSLSSTRIPTGLLLGIQKTFPSMSRDLIRWSMMMMMMMIMMILMMMMMTTMMMT